jgi:hypothetical protein
LAYSLQSYKNIAKHRVNKSLPPAVSPLPDASGLLPGSRNSEIYAIPCGMYFILNRIYYILHRICFILDRIFNIIHGIRYILYVIYFILNRIYYILYITHFILNKILNILHGVIYILYRAFSNLYPFHGNVPIYTVILLYIPVDL